MAETSAPAVVTSRSKPRRPVPERSEDFAQYDLEGLRGLRTALTEEENRISYWRRIVQARIDIMRVDGDEAAVLNLRRVLSERSGSGHRLVLVDSAAHDATPPLPDLAALWDADPRTSADRSRVLEQLETAEGQLSGYRTTLHRWLDAATGELVARYREEPTLALRILPLRGPLD